MTKLRENRFVTLETFMKDNESPVSIPNFNFVLRFQRNKAPYSSNVDVTISTSIRIGDLCAVECRINLNGNNSPKLILIAIYISPNSAMTDIKLFMGKSLLPLLTAGFRGGHLGSWESNYAEAFYNKGKKRSFKGFCSD
ncbi:hypothetical protein PV325_009892 [Microctonus aethiopoides]|nr:hypothetical protein PV325_009892 [Microctonus aethiopoides]